MVTRVQEHDELHCLLATGVEVLQVLSDLREKALNIFDLKIRPLLSVNAVEVITEDESFDIENLILLETEFFALCDEKFKQNALVLLVDHTVSEDSLVLVDPNSDDVNRCLGRFLVS